MITPNQLGQLDVHPDNHAAVAVNCFGQKFLERELANDHQDFVALVKVVKQTAEAQKLSAVFGLEDTEGNGNFLARHLLTSGFEVRSVNPVLVKRQRTYETHPEKSDLQDAFGVAKVLIEKIDSLPAFSITETSETAKDLHILTMERDSLVKEQIRLKNQLHQALRQTYGSDYRGVFKDVFSKKALTFWQEFPAAQVLTASRKHSVKKPEWLKKTPVGFLPPSSQTLNRHISRKAGRLLAIREELLEIEKELEKLIADTGQQLQTMRGCGAALSAVVLSEIKDIERFKTPSALAKYAGVAPKKFESGRTKRDRKSYSGNRRLNKAIYQIALTQISNQGLAKAKTYFAKKVGEGKTKKHALTCLMRQIIDIIWSMLKHKRAYYP